MADKPDAVAILKADHRKVEGLFEKFEKAKSDSVKKSLVQEICTELSIHTAIEEEIFYPAVKKARSEHVKDEVREAYEEHKQIKSLLAQVSSITSADEAYDMKIKVLKEDVEHHVEEEEGEMFPDAKRLLGETRLVEMGSQLAARKQELENKLASKPASGNQPRSAHIAK